MIRTIHDHRSAAESQAEASSSSDQIKDEDDDSLFTVARAGFLQLKLQALDNALTRVPMDQHKQLRLNDIVQSIHPRTYVSGSERLYFLVKDLSWPSKIPQVYINAYEEVLNCRPFTNKYIPRPTRVVEPLGAMPVSLRFAPTFSAIRLLLREIDASCHTKLSNFFDEAGYSVKPFPFTQLPTELRLDVYSLIFPCESFVRVRARSAWEDERLPEDLNIVRVSKAIHQEVMMNCLNKSTMLLEARFHPDTVLYDGVNMQDPLEKQAAHVTSMSANIRRNFTAVEIQVGPRSGYLQVGSERDRIDGSPLHRILTALPSVTVVVISFQEPRGAVVPEIMTLHWLRVLLPNRELRIAWDLTHYWRRSQNTRPLHKITMDSMIRDLVDRDGTLNLASSVTATSEDLQR